MKTLLLLLCFATSVATAQDTISSDEAMKQIGLHLQSHHNEFKDGYLAFGIGAAGFAGIATVHKWNLPVMYKGKNLYVSSLPLLMSGFGIVLMLDSDRYLWKAGRFWFYPNGVVVRY